MRTWLAVTAAGLLWTVWTLFSPVAEVSSCLHLPAGYAGSISQTTQEGILFFVRGREELILKANYRIEGQKLPKNFAWVITVPNAPDAYRIADPKIFKDLFEWSEKVARIPGRMTDRSLPMSNAISGQAVLEVGARVKVGPYEVQPVKARGKEGLAALNTWFKANGFPPSPEDKLSYFVENGFTFLAVKVTPQDGAFSGTADGELPPLQVSFAAERPYYPLKFFAMQGDMRLRLYVLSANKLDYAQSKEMLAALHAPLGIFRENVPVDTGQFPKVLHAALRDARSTLWDVDKWYLNVVDGEGFNRDRGLLAWKQDLYLDVEK